MIRYFRRSEWWGRASRKWVPAAFFLAALSFGTLSWAAETVSPGPENWGGIVAAVLAGATGVVAAITALMRQMNRARTAARKLQEDAKDSDEFRWEAFQARMDKLEKSQEHQNEALDKQAKTLERILKRVENLNRLQ